MNLFITTQHRAKMEGMVSLNTSTVKNPFCQAMMSNKNNVCSHCYAWQMERMYGRNLGYIEKYANNGHILSSRSLTNEELDRLCISFTGKRIVRLHSFGELLNITHVNNFIEICNRVPKTIFALWSKRKDLIANMHKPHNLITVYSTPVLDSIDEIIPEGYDKVFTVYTRKFVEKNSIKINCNAKCITCLKCYSRNTSKKIREMMK